MGRWGSDRPDRLRRMALATALDGLVLADDPLVEDLLHADELGHLALHQAGHGDARPPADDLGHVLRVDLLLEHALGGLEVGQLVGGRLQGRLQLGDAAVAQAGGGLQVGLPLHLRP